MCVGGGGGGGGDVYNMEGCRKARFGVWLCPKLQALVYDILPSTTAVFSYAIGSRKLSANEHFLFVLFLLVLKQ